MGGADVFEEPGAECFAKTSKSLQDISSSSSILPTSSFIEESVKLKVRDNNSQDESLLSLPSSACCSYVAQISGSIGWLIIHLSHENANYL